MGKPRQWTEQGIAIRRMLQEANARVKNHISSRTRRRRAKQQEAQQ